MAAALAGCATPGSGAAGRQPTLSIDGVTIRNELAYPVTEVMIEVPATGAFAGCGNLLPRSACSNQFQAFDYLANAVVVRWREHGKPHSTDAFVIEPPDDLEPGRPARVEVSIFAPGQAGAKLMQP